MACIATLSTRVDGDRISFTATCAGECAGGGRCQPTIEGLTSKDKRYELRHMGTGSKAAEAMISVTDDITRDDPIVVKAVCKCGGDDTGSADPYTINEHHPETTAKDVLVAIVTIGKLFGLLAK